jgi:hypothetical protein
MIYVTPLPEFSTLQMPGAMLYPYPFQKSPFFLFSASEHLNCPFGSGFTTSINVFRQSSFNPKIKH